MACRVHIGSSKTQKTLCGAPLARRWWNPLKRREFGSARQPSSLEQRFSCAECIKAAKVSK